MDEHNSGQEDETARSRPGFSTRAIHHGDVPISQSERPVAAPLWPTTDWLYEGFDHYADVINERRPGYVYARYGNPTHTALHQVLASLDEAEGAWSFASGMAAIQTVLLDLLEAGDHVVAQRALYGGTFSLMTKLLPRFGVDVSFVDPEAVAVAEALRAGTRLVFLESLANPTFRVSDLEGIAKVCAERDVSLLVDNTMATPYLLRPRAIDGVRLVIHATTKYISGHSNVMGGSVAGGGDDIDRIRHLAIDLGTTTGAFDAWLVLQGLQTLELRMNRQCQSALAVAGFLEQHHAVAEVGYSGLPGHPDHDRATALFGGRGYGAMLAFTLEGGYEAAARVCDALGLIRVGSSFGSQRSQVCHPATTSHRQLSPEERAAAGIGEGLVRLAVGGEDVEDLIADLERALEGA